MTTPLASHCTASNSAIIPLDQVPVPTVPPLGKVQVPEYVPKHGGKPFVASSSVMDGGIVPTDAEGLGDGDGLRDGEGLGDGDGLRDGEGLGDGDGLRDGKGLGDGDAVAEVA
jgi:hypothetical protein